MEELPLPFSPGGIFQELLGKFVGIMEFCKWFLQDMLVLDIWICWCLTKPELKDAVNNETK